MNAPILEFDPTRAAVIEPTNIVRRADVSERCVLCFFADVLEKIVAERKPRIAAQTGSEIGEVRVYELEVDGRPVAFMHPGVGAPLSAAFLEEAIAFGCRKFIACGGAGALVRDLTLGHLVVPSSAVRDEGTSYHYLPASRDVSAHPDAVRAIENVLKRDGVPYVVGKTWTTDGLYRETLGKVAARRAEGCLTVEMEAAAFFAVAQFREVKFGQILYAGDDLSAETWDSRHWTRQSSLREKLFWLSVEACLEL